MRSRRGLGAWPRLSLCFGLTLTLVACSSCGAEKRRPSSSLDGGVGGAGGGTGGGWCLGAMNCNTAGAIGSTGVGGDCESAWPSAPPFPEASPPLEVTPGILWRKSHDLNWPYARGVISAGDRLAVVMGAGMVFFSLSGDLLAESQRVGVERFSDPVAGEQQ